MAALNGAWKARLGDDHVIKLDALAAISETALTRDTAIAIAEKLSAEKVQNAATTLGLAVPDPGDIGYLSYNDSDLAKAAIGFGSRNAICRKQPQRQGFR